MSEKKQKIGRPPTYLTSMSIRVTPDFEQKIRAEALERGLSVGAYIMWVFKNAAQN